MAMTQGEESNGRGRANHTNNGRSADDDAVLRARLSKLSNALQQHRDPAEPSVPELSGESLGASNLGFRVLVEFISAIVVGALIGWQFDKWLHTGPILLILFLVLGMTAGMVNIYRIAAGPTRKRD